MAPAADGGSHPIAVHGNRNGPQVMTRVRNDIANLAAQYREHGDEVAIEVVACGPGHHMPIDDRRPVADRIRRWRRRGAGVLVRPVELQEIGFGYVRP